MNTLICFTTMKCNKESSRCAYLLLCLNFHLFPLKFGCAKKSTRSVFDSVTSNAEGELNWFPSDFLSVTIFVAVWHFHLISM